MSTFGFSESSKRGATPAPLFFIAAHFIWAVRMEHVNGWEMPRGSYLEPQVPLFDDAPFDCLGVSE
jgi:hypothetical protein